MMSSLGLFSLSVAIGLQILLSSDIQIVEVNHLSPLPILGIASYVGIVSGYIPSPLYPRNERWPNLYVRFQILLLALTVLRLRRRRAITSLSDMEANNNSLTNMEEDDTEEDDDGYDNNLEELSEFTHWLGTNLHKLFYGGAEGLFEFVEAFGEEILFFLFAVVISKVVQRQSWLNSWDASETLSMPVVFLRNCILYTLISTFIIWEDYTDTDSGIQSFCHKEYGMTTPGWVAPNYTLAEMTSDFTEAWKTFHLSHLWLIRISHAILYPTILLTLSQRRFTTFLVWTLFNEIDVFHLLADMVHYVSGPELAEQRLEFQAEAKDCYINVPLFQTLFAYPMNFVYLTTPLGDTHSIEEVEV